MPQLRRASNDNIAMKIARQPQPNAATPTQITLKFQMQHGGVSLPYVPQGITLEKIELPAPAFISIGSADAPKNVAVTARYHGKIQFHPGGRFTTLPLELDLGKDGETPVSCLRVDSNGNGDFTDDPAPSWEKVGEMQPTTLDVASGALNFQLTVNGFWQDDGTPLLGYYRNYFPTTFLIEPLLDAQGSFQALLATALTGQLSPLCKAFRLHRFALNDRDSSGDFSYPKRSKGLLLMGVDFNANGAFENPEDWNVNAPFIVGKHEFRVKEISRDGTSVVMAMEGAKGRVQKLNYQTDLGGIVPELTGTIFNGAHQGETVVLGAAAAEVPNNFAKGKILLVDFWGAWCAPCLGAMPSIYELRAALQTEFGAELFDVLGIDTGDGAKTTDEVMEVVARQARVYAEEHGLDAGHVHFDWPHISDPKKIVATKWFIEEYPTIFVVDGDTGEVVLPRKDRPTIESLVRKPGDAQDPPLLTALKEALKRKAAQAPEPPK